MPDKDLKITKFRNQHFYLSNFCPVKIEYEGLIYPCVENAYQASKFFGNKNREIFTTARAATAKKLGRSSKITTMNWNHIKVAIMRSLIHQKFKKEPFRSLLISTGVTPIIEENTWGDVFWGKCKGVGENTLGKILMEERDLLHSQWKNRLNTEASKKKPKALRKKHYGHTPVSCKSR